MKFVSDISLSHSVTQSLNHSITFRHITIIAEICFGHFSYSVTYENPKVVTDSDKSETQTKGIKWALLHGIVEGDPTTPPAELHTRAIQRSIPHAPTTQAHTDIQLSASILDVYVCISVCVCLYVYVCVCVCVHLCKLSVRTSFVCIH